MKFLIGIVIVMLGVLTLSIANNTEQIYNREVIVIDIQGQEVITKDKSGFVWSFDSNNDIAIGQHLTLTMNDMHTSTIFDDEIVDIK